MGKFLLGLVLGSILTGAIATAADYLHQSGGDYLGRSETQAQFDYFRERAMQLDVENIRRQQTEQRHEDQLRRALGKSPC